MKIVHVSPTYPPMIGGMQNVIKELAERTAKKGHQVTVVTSSCTGGRKPTASNLIKLVRVWSIKINRVPIIMPMLPFKLLKLIDSKTLIHVHYVLNPFMDIAIFIARFKKAKIILHFHIDPLPAGVFGFLNRPYKKQVWKRSLPVSEAVICPTWDYVAIAQGYGVPEEKCIVIPSGVDLTQFKRKLSSGISKPVNILFVGRLSKQKNIPRLLEAFRLFQASHDAVLHLVGDGEDRQQIADIIAGNHLPNVIMHGAMSGEELAKAYTSSDIFILPSDYESFGIVNLEAMASGLPIVASDIPGLRNLLKGTALLVKPTAENLAAAMSRLVEDAGLRAELVSKGFEKVRDYDWDTITDRVIDLYHKVDD